MIPAISMELKSDIYSGDNWRIRMMASKLKLITIVVSLTAILFCAWAKPLDDFAMQQVDAGFKRAVISFGTARLLGAVISVAQGTDVIMQPVGIGVKFAPGQVLQPINDLVGKFADLMLTATVIFGAMKVLLLIGGNYWSSMAVTGATVLWIWYYWRGRPSPLWLSRLAVILMLIRFAVPVVMVGSDAVFQQFMADDYKSSQSALDVTAGTIESSPMPQASSDNEIGMWEKMKGWVATNIDVPARLKSMAQGATKLVEHIIKLIVLFMLQTLVIPLVFFWALYRVVTAMFQNPLTRRGKFAPEISSQKSGGLS